MAGALRLGPNNAVGLHPSNEGRLAGIVATTEVSAQPVRRAIVRLTEINRRIELATVTDDSGHFEFATVADGLYSVCAVRPGYLSIPYGASGPGRTGTPLVVRAGQNIEGLRLLIAKGSVIAGTVRDSEGMALAEVSVVAERRGRSGVWVQESQTVKTDSDGGYRVFGLPAGEYLVKALPIVPSVAAPLPVSSMSDSSFERLQQTILARRAAEDSAPDSKSSAPVFVPVFHQNALTREAGLKIALAEGQEFAGADITVSPAPTAIVSGNIVPLPGTAIPALDMKLIPEDGSAVPSIRLMRTLTADGRFFFGGVVPGQYQLLARTIATDRKQIGQSTPAFAVLDVTITGTDVTGIQLALQPTTAIRGRLVLSGGTELGVPDSANAVVSLMQYRQSRDGRELVPVGDQATTRPASGGGFEFRGILPGTYYVSVGVPRIADNPGWWIDSVQVDGRNVTDTGIVIERGSSTPVTAVIALTNQQSILSGLLTGLGGLPAVDYSIVAFSVDKEWWSPPFRRVRVVRPSSSGRFEFDELPGGDYHLAVLLDLNPMEWQDPTFLEQLVAKSVRVEVRVGQRTIQDLRVLR
ncbi:MAG TPA: carboxypeptidase-like regulatory domain-containing protein [Vicinamibacterales bacterium]|nr:carboxypeptidase-like regulatory domain-containing protein [Vicinamibacterales bacterium]